MCLCIYVYVFYDILYTYEPRSKLPAIDFSIRWNLFLKKLNGVTRAQAFHKLRASSCTRKFRASPKSRRKLKQKWMNIQRTGLHNIMGRDEMGDEFRCFLVALFAWYVGPLACKGIVSLSKQDFEWMSWILHGNRPWRQLLRVILTLEDFTHPEFCARFAQASRKKRGSWPLCPTETGSKIIVDSPYWLHFATMLFLSGTLSKTTARTGSHAAVLIVPWLKAIHSLEALRDYAAGKIGTALIGA